MYTNRVAGTEVVVTKVAGTSLMVADSKIQGQERERLREVAEDYRAKGYQISFRPPLEELPEFLKPYRPALIVRRDDEAIIVEVKSRNSLDVATRQHIQYLLQEVENHPGWHFEFVLTPTTDDQLVVDDIALLEAEDIQGKLAIARPLLSHSTEAALLYTCALTEAVLRLLAKAEAIELDRFDPRYLIKKLTSEGILSRDQYRSLDALLDLRNTVAHGFQSSHLTQQTVLDLIELTEKLLGDLAQEI